MGSTIGVDRSRLIWRLTAICTIANVAGSVFVFAYLVGIAPSERSQHGPVPDAVAFAIFAVCAFSLEAWWSSVNWQRALGWLALDRMPTSDERDATLRLPLREAGRSSVAWLVASVVFGVFSVMVDGVGAHGIRIAMTILDGGLVTCAVLFLLFERALRPVFAYALAGESPRDTVSIGVRPRLML
ncbi:MAG: hypothetical protein JWM72_1030, partial [Actinomycetia bacterium]|nr:hypothetical protein [Actinomycetes bacterium]